MRPPDRDEGTAKFLRGLTIGALLGAVIAGSSIWTRRAARRGIQDVPTPRDGAGPGAATPPNRQG